MEKCKETPIWKEAEKDHWVACHLIDWWKRIYCLLIWRNMVW